MPNYKTPYGEFTGTEEQYKEFLSVMEGEKKSEEKPSEEKPKKVSTKKK